MIVTDSMDYIRSDLATFGIGVFVFLVLILAIACGAGVWGGSEMKIKRLTTVVFTDAAVARRDMPSGTPIRNPCEGDG